MDKILENEDGTYSHSYRHYSPEYFQNLLDKAETRQEMVQIRATFRHMEDGRFKEMISTVHRMVSALDPDEREDFFDSNPRMKTWVNIYAEIEEMRQYE